MMRLALSSADLVPGDVVVVGPGKVACDMLLLTGECVVDETVLTGGRAYMCRVTWCNMGACMLTGGESVVDETGLTGVGGQRL